MHSNKKYSIFFFLLQEFFQKNQKIMYFSVAEPIFTEDVPKQSFARFGSEQEI